MKSVKFKNLSKDEKQAIFQEVGNRIGLPPFVVEKDWWVVQSLSIIFQMEVAKHLVFKGGTSLSKSWNLINRFSEDIDLAIDRKFFGYDGNLSRQQITELRKEASKFTTGHFFEDLKEKFILEGLEVSEFSIKEAEASDQDPRIINISYQNVINTPGYVQPRVQIEIGSRSLREPYTYKNISSFVDEEYNKEDFTEDPVKVPTVNPERTFLEKIFLLHEEFQRPLEKMRVERLSRHIYDIVTLSKTPFAEIALNDPGLYEIIVDHRHKFTRVGGVDYNLHQPQTIDPVPISSVIDNWENDYKTMLEQMIFEQHPPSFEEAIKSLIELKKKINNLPWKLLKAY